MKPVLAAKNSKPTDIAYAVSHDLRAPLINVRGFSEELAQSISVLTELSKEYSASLPEEYQKKFQAIANDDIQPCIKFLTSSVVQLESQVDHIARHFALDSHDSAGKKIYDPIDGKRSR